MMMRGGIAVLGFLLAALWGGAVAQAAEPKRAGNETPVLFSAEEVHHVINGGPLEALVKLREQGTIGHIGVTSEEPWTVIPFLAHKDIEVYQIAYNIIYQAAARHFLSVSGLRQHGLAFVRHQEVVHIVGVLLLVG